MMIDGKMAEAPQIRRSKRCEWLDWHRPGVPVRFSAGSAAGYVPTCQRCGRDLLMDSQGNWFGYGPPRALERERGA